jgi:hypothetical protein
MADNEEKSRSRADLDKWGVELWRRAGLRGEYGFHLLSWEHEEWCPLHPTHDRAEDAGSCCECQPNCALILHVGMPDERRVELVRDGVALPTIRGRVQ